MSFSFAVIETVLILILLGMLIFFRLRYRAARESLQACTDELEKIFKILEEPSAVTRILSQEPPEQELKRVADLLSHRNQKALSENEALRGLLNGLLDGILAVTPDLVVVACNTAFCRLMQIPETPHEGKRLFEILRYHAALLAAEEFFHDSEESRKETEFQIPDDKKIRLTLIRMEKTHSFAALLVFSDVSAIKKLENMRRDFVANVSHELRTPLTSIQGFVETLLSGADEDADARGRFLELIRNDTERLGRLIEDLLVLSRIENPAQVFKKEKLSATREIEQVLDLFRLRFVQKKIALTSKIEPDLELHAHRDQFRQVLINILDNALNYTPAGGRVNLTADKAGQAGIEIRVVDTGTGIHPDNREKVFQRFFREDRARSRETGGTGLGLSIVKHIMETHHGRVYCDAGPEGQGTVFSLFFPVA